MTAHFFYCRMKMMGSFWCFALTHKMKKKLILLSLMLKQWWKYAGPLWPLHQLYLCLYTVTIYLPTASKQLTTPSNVRIYYSYHHRCTTAPVVVSRIILSWYRCTLADPRHGACKWAVLIFSINRDYRKHWKKSSKVPLTVNAMLLTHCVSGYDQ